jgi:hypothetical protein
VGRTVRINRVVATAVLAVAGTVMVEVGAVGVASAAPVASGTVSCSIAGNGKFGPPLVAVASGTGAIEKVKFSGKTASCSSSAGAGGRVITINGANFKAAGKLKDPTTAVAAKSCNSFTNADQIQVIKVKINWIASPPIAPTVVKYTLGTAPWVSNNAGSDRLKMPSTATTTITGSFATATSALMNLDSNIVNACGTTWGPYPTFNFGTVSSALTIT